MNKTEIVRHRPDGAETAEDWLSAEEPLEIRIRYFDGEREKTLPLSVTMRTPGEDSELALGFLFAENVIRGAEDVLGAEHVRTLSAHARGNRMLVRLAENVRPDPEKLKRNFYANSSCGVCGKASIEAVRQIFGLGGEDDRGVEIPAETLSKMPMKLAERQRQFRRTGGIHAAGIFDLEGNLVCLREDVGRHNALDKAIGKMLADNRVPLTANPVCLSGRIGFELVQKAHMAGVKILCAVGAPSSLAVELAEETDMTLAGFVKGDGRFNAYANPHRIIPAKVKN